MRAALTARSDRPCSALTSSEEAGACLRTSCLLLIINTPVRLCGGRYDDTTKRWAKNGHCLRRFALKPALPRRLCSGHPTSMSAVPMPVMAGSPSPSGSSASANRLCQLNSWPCTQWTACTSIPPNVLQGQKEPASTSPRSSWLNPNLGEMQAVLMERGEIAAHYFLLQHPSNFNKILSKYQTHLPDSYTRKGLNSKVANLWVTQCYLW